MNTNFGEPLIDRSGRVVVILDIDDPSHVEWVWKVSKYLAIRYQIELNFKEMKTIWGEIIGIIPSLSSTNAIIGSIGSLETFKLVMAGLNPGINYTRFDGRRGIYSSNHFLEKTNDCNLCETKTIVARINVDVTLRQFLDILFSEGGINVHSIVFLSEIIYISRPLMFEKINGPNLEKTVFNLTNKPSSDVLLKTFSSKERTDVKVFFGKTNWSPKSHSLYGEKSNQIALNFICSLKLTNNFNLKIPKVIIHLILHFALECNSVVRVLGKKKARIPWF